MRFIAEKIYNEIGAWLEEAAWNDSASGSISDFDKVRRVKANRRQHLIKVNQTLERNQVYVTEEDFDFVLDFIRKHCPNAK